MYRADLTARIGELQRSELRLCRALNQLSDPWIRLLRVVSRIGDGGIWYAHIVVVPVIFGTGGAEFALLATQGIVSTLVYKAIKHGTRRTRPGHHTTSDVHLLANALDRYSFPSGHTQHAVGFSTVPSRTRIPCSACTSGRSRRSSRSRGSPSGCTTPRTWRQAPLWARFSPSRCSPSAGELSDAGARSQCPDCFRSLESELWTRGRALDVPRARDCKNTQTPSQMP
jgi:hypothetical protein